MRLSGWHFRLGLSLIVVSALSYTLQVLVFHRTEDTLFYLLQDFAFLPIQVLLVVLVLNDVLAQRERALLHEKLNMVIGAFFTEIGDDLLRTLLQVDANLAEARDTLRLDANTSPAKFAAMKRYAAARDYNLVCSPRGLEEMRSFLAARRAFILRLLENPNLLEHESFTDLLWAISHLTEELLRRSNFTAPHAEDLAHLSGDVVRAYRALLTEWLSYVQHLQERYPYMYSLVVRTSPFEPEPSAEVTCAK